MNQLDFLDSKSDVMNPHALEKVFFQNFLATSDSVCTHAKVDVGFAYDYERNGFQAKIFRNILAFFRYQSTFYNLDWHFCWWKWLNRVQTLALPSRVNNNIEENVILPTFEVKIVKKKPDDSYPYPDPSEDLSPSSAPTDLCHAYPAEATGICAPYLRDR